MKKGDRERNKKEEKNTSGNGGRGWRSGSNLPNPSRTNPVTGIKCSG